MCPFGRRGLIIEWGEKLKVSNMEVILHYSCEAAIGIPYFLWKWF
jgi:hypothetical protein